MKERLDIIINNLRDWDRLSETERPAVDGEALRMLLLNVFIIAACRAGIVIRGDAAMQQALLDAAGGADDLGHVGTQKQYALALWALCDEPAALSVIESRRDVIEALVESSAAFYTSQIDPLPGGVALAV